MKFNTLFASFLLSKSLAQTTTSYDSSEWASASSRALESDVSVIYDFILDINSRYTTYLEYMAENDMSLPTAIVNYIAEINTISEEASLSSAIETLSFPFEDFYTMVTAFTWYSSILEKDGMTTFYTPGDFLTAEAADASVSSSSSSASATESVSTVVSSSLISSSGSNAVYTTTTISSTVAVSDSASSDDSDASSSTSKESSSSSSSESSAASTVDTASDNGVAQLYAPVISLPFLLAALMI